MKNTDDLSGNKYGRLLVLHETKKIKGRYRAWFCRCDCGSNVEVRENSLKTGNTKSCGCLIRDRLLERNTKHNMSNSKFYDIWENMKYRCDNINHDFYYCYGGRGISYDDSWSDFSGFKNDMYSTYSEGLTLERIDVNGDYCKSNCTWIEKGEQAKNRRKPSNNTSGFIGVSEHYNSSGTLYFRVRWVEGGKNKVKYFSTKKYEDAFAAACDFRYTKQKELGYGEGHGS